MKERPILFSSAMVKAILERRKTMTRRPVKPQPVYAPGIGEVWRGSDCAEEWKKSCPYGIPGDRLWVQETWQAIHVSVDPETKLGDDVWSAPKIPRDSENGFWRVTYKATDPQAEEPSEDRGFSWRSPIHMPRWASRITLEITEVGVDRLQEISEIDAKREGVERYNEGWDGPEGPGFSYVAGFRELWKSIYGNESWISSPWVWAIGFKVV